MSDGQDNENRPGRPPLTLKPRVGGGVSSGTVKQSFSHGRSKTVVVETKRRRLEGAPVNLAAPSPAEKRPEARPPTAAPRPAAQPTGGLSQEELQARQRVLENARRDQERRDAQRRAEEDARRREAEARAAQAQPAAEAAQPAPAAPKPAAEAPPPAAPVERPAAPAAAAPQPLPTRTYEARQGDVRREERTSTTTYRPPAGGAAARGDGPRPDFRNERAPREAGLGPRPPREGATTYREASRGERPAPRAGETVRFSATAPRPAPREGARPGGPPRPGAGRGPAAAPATAEVQRAARTAPPSAAKDRRPADFEDDRKAGRAEPGKAVSRVKGAPQRREGRLTIQAVAGDEDSAERMRSLASVRRAREREKEKRKGGGAQDTQLAKRDVVIPDVITVQDLSQRMATRGVDVIKFMMRQGMMLKINDVLDADTAELIATEFGHTVTRVSESDVETGFLTAEDRDEHQAPRPPVVAVMGHVDHGKTSLLDALRSADVAGGEHGGITQHIGAYQVRLEGGQRVTFLDTPGHAAFSAMRARGANVTDIVILVVAADDGVMPQTIEAINHAKAAGAPIIVAINKVDKPDADPTRVINELLQHEIVVESLGGDTQVIQVSALKRTGLDNLVESILLQAEVMDLKANPDRTAEGVVIESKLDKGRGAVATVLVKRGALQRSDIVVAGANWGRVRALINERDEQVTAAGPSEPVAVLGLDGTPDPGEPFAVVESEARAREITAYRIRQKRERVVSPSAAGGTTLADMMAKLQDKRVSELPLVIKGDVQGSVEAIIGSLDKISTEEVRARIIHAAAGAINESDVMLAKGAGSPVLGFNVRASRQARDLAEREGVEIRYYAVIYDLLDDIKGVLSGMLAPIQRETFLGNAEVLQAFDISKVGKIAGCRVTEGVVRKGAKVRIVRENVVVLELGTLQTLKRFKDEVNEVNAGQECGMAFAGFQDIREGDQIECFTVEEVQRSL